MNHYRNIRQTLMRKFPGSAIIHLEGGIPVNRNFDVEYVFRQKSDFLYLSGVEEPGCHIILDPKKNKHILFIPRIDNHHRVWEGNVPTPAEAKKLFDFDEVYYKDELKSFVTRRKIVSPSLLRDALDDLRACKSKSELDLLKMANDVSSKAHRMVMQHVRPGMMEYQVQALFESECMNAGLKHLAYPSIVAAGINSAVLHYRQNRSVLKENELLLIDAGAEHHGYAADITRTIPVSGRFTNRQRDVYQIVLETQKKCIDLARPGIVSAQLHVSSMRFIAEGLKSLGFLKGDIDGLVEGGAVRLFYPHGLTHMLGLDVHDVMGGTRRVLPNPTKVPVRFVAKLEPGFVITMEPGIYFIPALLNEPLTRKRFKSSVNFSLAEKYFDFGGIRIEDDIVITAHGNARNLTTVPKEVSEVQDICSSLR